MAYKSRVLNSADNLSMTSSATGIIDRIAPLQWDQWKGRPQSVHVLRPYDTTKGSRTAAKAICVNVLLRGSGVAGVEALPGAADVEALPGAADVEALPGVEALLAPAGARTMCPSTNSRRSLFVKSSTCRAAVAGSWSCTSKHRRNSTHTSP